MEKCILETCNCKQVLLLSQTLILTLTLYFFDYKLIYSGYSVVFFYSIMIFHKPNKIVVMDLDTLSTNKPINA